MRLGQRPAATSTCLPQRSPSLTRRRWGSGSPHAALARRRRRGADDRARLLRDARGAPALRCTGSGAYVSTTTRVVHPRPRSSPGSAVVSRGRTRVVALTWVHSSTGVKLPLRAIADALPERALPCVDGVHGFGAEAATVRELGCDAFTSGCHKWLYGPRGTGILWANERVRALLRPVIPSFDDRATAPGSRAACPPGDPTAPDSRPAGSTRSSTAGRWPMHSASTRRLRSCACRRARSLAAQLKTALEEVRGVRLRTPTGAGVSAGLVCFELDRFGPDQVVRRLATRRIVASVTPYAPTSGSVQGIVNSPADVDAVVRAVAVA